MHQSSDTLQNPTSLPGDWGLYPNKTGVLWRHARLLTGHCELPLSWPPWSGRPTVAWSSDAIADGLWAHLSTGRAVNVLLDGLSCPFEHEQASGGIPWLHVQLWGHRWTGKRVQE